MTKRKKRSEKMPVDTAWEVHPNESNAPTSVVVTPVFAVVETSTPEPPKPELVSHNLAPYDQTVLSDAQKQYLREMQVPGAYMIPEHSGCAGLRKDGLRYGVVVHTAKVNEPDRTIITRYCHCRFCRPWSAIDSRIEYRYKDVQIIVHRK